MSRLGKKPVPIPDGVKVSVNGNIVKAEGPKGTLEFKAPANMKVKVDEAKKVVVVEGTYTTPQDNINHGTARSHINNMLIGVHHGYEEKMEIIGTGYKAVMDGKNLAISLGYSHPIKVDVPAGVAVTIPNPNLLVINGANKQVIGAFAAKIKAIKPSEPYNLKGIKYADEVIKRKTGKTFVSGTA
ncbi:MAG: 50S ribosomal protein L6 [Planctomycetota bacterium]